MSEKRDNDTRLIEEFSVALANGDLSGELKVKGTMAGSLKSLQSSLRHLTWQTKQVAEGDFSQRVDFMGEFSDSFNYMVERLEKTAAERDAREKQLSEMNHQLSCEIEKRMKAEEALLRSGKKFHTINSVTRHDIKNQLTALQAYLEFMDDETNEIRRAEFTSKAGRAAEKIYHLIDFTRQFETLGLDVPTWIDLGSIVRKVNDEFGTLGIEIRNEISGIEVFTDPLIEKVIYNLVENSVNHGRDVSCITLSYKEQNNTLLFIYTDNGQGIPDSDKSRIFLKGFGTNTGLGMYFCREILSVSGITIEETGTHGEGVRFEMVAPPEICRKQ